MQSYIIAFDENYRLQYSFRILRLLVSTTKNIFSSVTLLISIPHSLTSDSEILVS